MMERLKRFFTLETRIEPDHSSSPSDELEQARLARERARVLDQEVRSRAPRVEKVTRTIAEIRVQNHFGEAVEASMRTRRKLS